MRKCLDLGMLDENLIYDIDRRNQASIAVLRSQMMREYIESKSARRMSSIYQAKIDYICTPQCSKISRFILVTDIVQLDLHLIAQNSAYLLQTVACTPWCGTWMKLVNSAIGCVKWYVTYVGRDTENLRE